MYNETDAEILSVSPIPYMVYMRARENKRKSIMTTKNTSAPDSWGTRIEQFAKIVGLELTEVEAAMAEKPFELTKDTPYVMEMLSDNEVTPFGDIRKMFCDDRDVSLPKLRLGVKYLRGPKDKREEATTNIDPDIMDLQTKYGIKTRLSDLGAEELIPLYNPTKSNRITQTLKDMFGSQKVIAFKPDSTVIAVEETVNYIVDINNGLPEEEEAIDVDGELVRLYPIGKLPNQTVEEDPLFVGQPLKRGRSVVNRVNWTEFDQQARQFARILVDEEEIDPDDRLHIRQLLADLRSGINTRKEQYPETYMIFKELQMKDGLPKLILSMDEASTSKVNDPFGIKSNRRY